MIPRIYIAGPYTAPTREERELNTRKAESIGGLVIRAGGYPIVPHRTGIRYEHIRDDYEWWLSVTSEELATCHAAVFVPDWKLSRGSRLERKQCERDEQPCFDVGIGGLGDDFREWIEWFTQAQPSQS